MNVNFYQPSLIHRSGIVRNLRLGEDIQEIATAPEFMEEVQDHLQQQGLAKKVTVISFAALALEKLNQAFCKSA